MIEKKITLKEFEERFNPSEMSSIVQRMAACLEETKKESSGYPRAGYKSYELIVTELDDFIKGESFEEPTRYRIELNPVLCEMMDKQFRIGALSVKRQLKALTTW